ncbi:MAG: hypothetical protein LBQ50_01805 [Planctomycetaceae bacterium]|nr:hypothetical protein [Planctomycetaceae bacterium]
MPFHGLAFSLPDSAFLWEIKEEVTINYTPFVILEHNDDKEKKIQLRNENHRVEFCYVTETGYINQNKQIEQSILTIELKENGLNFDWDQSWLSGINADRDKRRELNRILLAKLKVEIKGIGAKEIALLSPTKYTQADFENLLKGKTDNSFALWKQEGEGGKEFIVYEKDNVAMLLDFDEWVDNKGKHSVIDKKFRKILSSLGYSPNVHEDFSFIIQSSEENLNVKIESYPTSVEPLQKKAKEIEDQINKLKKQTPKNQRQIEFELKNLSAQIRSLTEQFALTPDHVTEKREKRTVLETKIKELQDEMKQVKVIDNKIYELKKDLDNKLKEIKQERFAWNNVRMEAFSIYLLKHDTKPEDVDKPENRLLLFEVKP